MESVMTSDDLRLYDELKAVLNGAQRAYLYVIHSTKHIVEILYWLGCGSC